MRHQLALWRWRFWCRARDKALIRHKRSLEQLRRLEAKQQ